MLLLVMAAGVVVFVVVVALLAVLVLVLAAVLALVFLFLVLLLLLLLCAAALFALAATCNSKAAQQCQDRAPLGLHDPAPSPFPPTKHSNVEHSNPLIHSNDTEQSAKTGRNG